MAKLPGFGDLPADLLRAELAERSLSEFTHQAWRTVETAEFKSNWHIDAISEHLEALSRGTLGNHLLINMPPRHMKSLSVNVFWPAWTWAQNPDPDGIGHGNPVRPGTWMGPGVKYLFGSYAIGLAIRDSVKCRRVLDSKWYQRNWGERVAFTKDQNEKSRFQNTASGERLITSVGSKLTGEGGDIIVIDDPHNVLEAESDTVREETLLWWDEALPTRFNDPKSGRFVVIMQRVHENDLAGHILAHEMGWEHLCLPARCELDHPHRSVSSLGFTDPREEGELLWEERFGEDEITKLELKLGSYAAAGQLQQRPAPREGGMFHKSWFEIVPAAPANARRVRAWDLAATKKQTSKSDPDWTANVKMSIDHAGTLYIEHADRFRESSGTVEKRIKNYASQDGRGVVIDIPQDPGQAGKAQVGYYARQLIGYVVRFSTPTGDKVQRADPFAAQCEAGNVKIVKGSWNDAFLAELTTFPNGAHDDWVDACSSGFNRLTTAKRAASKQL